MLTVMLAMSFMKILTTRPVFVLISSLVSISNAGLLATFAQAYRTPTSKLTFFFLRIERGGGAIFFLRDDKSSSDYRNDHSTAGLN